MLKKVLLAAAVAALALVAVPAPASAGPVTPQLKCERDNEWPCSPNWPGGR